MTKLQRVYRILAVFVVLPFCAVLGCEPATETISAANTTTQISEQIRKQPEVPEATADDFSQIHKQWTQATTRLRKINSILSDGNATNQRDLKKEFEALQKKSTFGAIGWPLIQKKMRTRKKSNQFYSKQQLRRSPTRQLRPDRSLYPTP